MRKIRIKICLLAAMLAVATGIQASDFVVDELCYNITDAEAKTVEVAKYDYAVDGEMVRPTKMDVVVPMTVVNPNDNQTYRVTALGDGAFTVYGLRGGWFDYTSIVLPEGLLEIKANAFSGAEQIDVARNSRHGEVGKNEICTNVGHQRTDISGIGEGDGHD